MRYTNNQWNGILYYTTPRNPGDDPQFVEAWCQKHSIYSKFHLTMAEIMEEQKDVGCVQVIGAGFLREIQPNQVVSGSIDTTDTPS